MSLLYWLDEKIIDLFEKFCHKFQLWTGKTNFFLARVTIVVFVGSALIEFFGAFKAKSLDVSLASIFFQTIYLSIVLCSLVRTADIVENVMNKIIISGYKNPFKIHPMVKTMRIFNFWITSFYGLAVFTMQDKISEYFLMYFLIILIGITFTFYFLSCTPLPPCRSSVKEFFGSLFAKPITAPSKS